MPSRYLEKQDTKNRRFWIIYGDRQTLKTRHGKIGTPGKVEAKTFASDRDCLLEFEALIQAQIAKGYREIDLNDASSLAELSADACRSLILSKDLPEIFWLHAARNPGRDLQAAIAESPHVPTTALEILAQSTYEDIAQLANLYLEANPETDIQTQIQALKLAPKRKTVLELASLGVIPEVLLNSLDLDLRIAIAKRAETAPSVLALLAKDFHDTVRQTIASHANTPADSLQILASDRSMDVRLRVAKNPNTPVAALKELANDPYKKVRQTVLKHPCVPGEVVYNLRQMLSYDAESALSKAAADPALPPQILAEMSEEHHWWIRQSVAENPNTATEIMAKLAVDPSAYVREAVAENPNVTAEILLKILSYIPVAETGNKMTELRFVSPNDMPLVRKQVAFSVGDREYVIENPIFDRDPDVLARAAMNPKLPLEVVAKLIEKLDEIYQLTWGIKVVVGIASNPNIPSDWLLEIAEAARRHLLAKSTPKKYPEHLVMRYEEPGLPQYPQEPPQSTTNFKASPWAYTDVKRFYWTIARHPNCPQKLYWELLERITEPIAGELHLDQGVILDLARDPDTPDRIIERLAQVKCDYTYEKLAERPNLPLSVLLKLAELGNRDVCTDLAQHPQTPAHILEELAKLPRGMAWINGSRPRSPLYENIAANPNTPITVLEQFARDEDELIRAAVASNPSVPIDLLAQLAEDRTVTGVYLRGDEQIYAGTGCEAGVANLAKPYLLVCLAAVKNPNLPISQLEKFAKDSDERVRSAAKVRLDEINSPEGAIESGESTILPQEEEQRRNKSLDLAKSKDLFVSVAIRSDLQAPPELLKLTDDPMHWLERYAIASNPHTAIEELHQLASDRHPLVRNAALLNPSSALAI